jgi:small subunit ribosomal protein S1
MSKQRIFRRRPQQAASPEPTPEPKAENVPAPVESVEVAAPPASPDPALDAGALEDLANMSFAEFSAAMDGIGPKPSRKRWSPGDSVSGIVVRIGGSDLFVDLGGKSEATLSREEAPEARVGDTVTAFVLKTGDELRLCKKLSGRHAVQGLEAAVESGIPMDGRVAERNTGGFVVELSGVRAFCPVSQIRGKDVVVGRRELAAEDSAKRVAELWTSLKPGLMLDGSVASIQDYGAFIELGGIQGLAHKSELTWDRRAKPSDLLKVGQRLRVQVIQVDKEAGKISLGLKDKLGEPGEDQGSPRSGRILPEGGMGLFAAAFEKANKK